MKNLIKNLPLPITGLMLGFATLGNLIQSRSEGLRGIFGSISALIFLLIVLKIILFPEDVKDSLQNPAIASVFPTFSMTMMVLATYIKPFNSIFAETFWYLGLVLHMAFIVWFTGKFVLNNNFNMQNVLPSWFTLYVGIAIASITSSVIRVQSIGKIAFMFSFIAFVVLLPIIFKRVFIIKQIPQPAIPTIAIVAAPASLCLAGYINAFELKSGALVYALLIIAQVFYWMVVLYLPRMLSLPFYPSYAGFTFPLVASGLALKLTNGFLINSGNPISFLPGLVFIEEIIAIALCVYVLIRFSVFLFAKRAIKCIRDT